MTHDVAAFDLEAAAHCALIVETIGIYLDKQGCFSLCITLYNSVFILYNYMYNCITV